MDTTKIEVGSFVGQKMAVDAGERCDFYLEVVHELLHSVEAMYGRCWYLTAAFSALRERKKIFISVKSAMCEWRYYLIAQTQ